MELPTLRITPKQTERRTKIEQRKNRLGFFVGWKSQPHRGAVTIQCRTKDAARNLAAVLDDPDVLHVCSEDPTRDEVKLATALRRLRDTMDDECECEHGFICAHCTAIHEADELLGKIEQ